VAYENHGPYCQAPDLAGTTFVPGYDFVNNDAHPNDDFWPWGHGTHVAGTIAQTTNNNDGFAGVVFDCSIMPVKIADAAGSYTDDDFYNGTLYAVDHGADIVSCSLGGTPSSDIEAAVEYAYTNGVTVIAAAGNEYETGNPPQYPAAYDNYVIAVGATRYDETRAPYSNTGSYLDLVAPGGDLNLDQNGDGYEDGVLQQTYLGSFCDFSSVYAEGTSMAAPHVSGVAALLIANGVTDPNSIKAWLESTADDLGASGWDNDYGWGLVNAAAALHNIGGEDILLVDDDQGANYETYYKNALAANGYEYDFCHSPPGASLLLKYPVVIWLTGDDSTTTLTATNRANLQTYLDSGGKLFISGQHIGWDIRSTSFYHDYLHANYLWHGHHYNLIGVTGDPIGDGLTLSIVGGDGANNQNEPDEISPHDESASTVFDYVGTGYGTIKANTGTYKVVYFGFGFEGIDNAADRNTVMSRVVSWLIANIPPVAIAKSDHRYNNVGSKYPCTTYLNGSLSYDPDGYIVEYKWDFGDGEIGYGERVEHIYSTYNWVGGPSGHYEPFNVRLTVKDNGGYTDTLYIGK